jgi:hypothetical protein
MLSSHGYLKIAVNQVKLCTVVTRIDRYLYGTDVCACSHCTIALCYRQQQDSSSSSSSAVAAAGGSAVDKSTPVEKNAAVSASAAAAAGGSANSKSNTGQMSAALLPAEGSSQPQGIGSSDGSGSSNSSTSTGSSNSHTVMEKAVQDYIKRAGYSEAAAAAAASRALAFTADFGVPKVIVLLLMPPIHMC